VNPLRTLPQLSDAFLRDSAREIATRGMRPADSWLVWYQESALDPSSGKVAYERNPNAAVGLSAILAAQLRRWGIDPAVYLTRSADAQLPVVLRMLDDQFRVYGGPLPDAAHYMSIQLRADGRVRRGASDETVIYAAPDPRYDANPLDTGHDGVLTIGDVRTWMARKAQEAPFQALLARARALGIDTTLGSAAPPTPRSSAGAWGGALLLLFGLGLAVVAGGRR
jgi:hypothetical protein